MEGEINERTPTTGRHFNVINSNFVKTISKGSEVEIVRKIVNLILLIRAYPNKLYSMKKRPLSKIQDKL